MAINEYQLTEIPDSNFFFKLSKSACSSASKSSAKFFLLILKYSDLNDSFALPVSLKHALLTKFSLDLPLNDLFSLERPPRVAAESLLSAMVEIVFLLVAENMNWNFFWAFCNCVLILIKFKEKLANWKQERYSLLN